jgi:hypothetical protein
LEQESSLIKKQKNQFQMYQMSHQEVRNKSMQGNQQSLNAQNDNKQLLNNKLSQNVTNYKKVLNSRNKGIK